MKKLLTLTFAMLLAFVLVACGGATKPESIEIKVSAKSVLVGRSVQLSATVKPAGASQEVTWSSDNNAIATVDETGKVTGVKSGRVVITATSKEETSVSQKVTITVREGSGDELDFEGYEIRIAFSPNVEYELDPRLEWGEDAGAPSADRIYDAQAWDEVCEKYNCTITVAGYPTIEYWDRFPYIIEQGKKNTTDFDIYWVPTNYIAQLSSVLLEMTDFYTIYGNNTMTQNDQLARTLKQSQLYGWSMSSGNITSDDPILGMNYELLKRIHMEDKEPAKLFMEDKWSFDEFVEWCLEAQTKLDSLEKATEDEKYYVISGRLSSWLRDMSAACGVALADTLGFKINLLDTTVAYIAKKLNDLQVAGCIDPADSTDEKVESWNTGHALLNCASSYWVDYPNRWKSNLWGEDTNYAFVPWPYKNGGTHESLRWSTYTQDCYVMPKAITEKIKGAAEDVTPANIYKVWVECFTRAKELREASDEYDKTRVNRINAENKWDTDASVTAWLYIQNNLDRIGIFNAIKELRQGNGVREEWDKAASAYILGTSAQDDYTATMSELVTDLENTFFSHYN